MKETLNHMFKTIATKVVAHEMDDNWPPQCALLLYQPERPAYKKKKVVEETEIISDQ